MKEHGFWCVVGTGSGGRRWFLFWTLAGTRKESIKLFLVELGPEKWSWWKKKHGYQVVKVSIEEGWN